MSHPSEPVYTLADLERWPASGTWLAVLGHPIKHSISPAMHNAAIAQLAAKDKRYAEWRYVRFDIPPERLPEALAAFQSRSFLGLNLTVPHKVLACGLIAKVHDAAAPAGAVNTLLRSTEGWVGFNTDGYGLATGLRNELGVEMTGADVVLLGAGGAARGAAVECLQRDVRSLWIANRTQSKTNELLATLTPLTKGKAALRGFVPGMTPHDLPAGAILINSTSVGLKPNEPAPAELTQYPKLAAVYDMVYNPPETALLSQARQLGIPCANGLSMLVNQGAKALSIWTGVPVSKFAATMSEAAHAAMGYAKH